MLGTSKNIWGFDPRSVPGCQLWLDGADSNTVTGTTSVTAWRDKSGNGNNAVFTGTNPSYTPANKYVETSNLNQEFSVPGTIFNTVGGSLFIVYADKQENTQNGMLFAISAGYSPYFFDQCLFRADGYSYALGGVDGPGNTFKTLMNTKNTIIHSTNYVHNTVNYTVTVNGTVFPFTSSGVVVPSGSLVFSGGWGGAANIKFNEILFFNSIITTSQRQQIEGYLAHKWGLAGYYDSSIPLSIPGCALWLDGADPAGTGTPPANGTILSTWADKSGNGRNATPTGTGPTYTANTFNGYSAPVFNGTTMRTPSYLITPDSKLSIFVLCKKTGLRQAGGNSDILSIAAGYQYFDLYIRTSQTNYLDIIYANTSISLTTYAINDGTNLLVSILTNGLSISGYLNGTSVFNTTAGSGGYPLNNLTSQWNISEAQFVGPICEIIIFNSTFTNAQRETIEGYLTRKWGLTTLYPSIPSTHPFYSVRPHLRPFQPTDVPGCQLWLDGADQGSMTLSGSSVVTILDKSGNGKTLSGGTGWTYNVTKFNGSYPSFYRATKGSMLGQNNTFSITSTNITVFFVGEVINNGGENYLVDGGSAGTNRFYTIIDTSTTNIVHGNTVNAGNNYSLPSTVFQPFIFSQSTGTSPQTGSYNGIEIIASAGTVGTITWSGITVGGRFTNASDWFSGHICEVLIYTTLLTTSERQQVEGYLAHKWGLSPTYATNTPLSIPGCQLWLDAADSSTITGTTSITAWRDKSGRGNNAVFTGTNPSYVAASNVVITANLNQGFTVPAATIQQTTGSGSIFLVYGDQQTQGSSYAALFSSPLPAQSFCQSLKRPDSYSYQFNNSTSPVLATVVNALNTTNTIIYTMNYTYNSTTGSIRVNGTTCASSFNSSPTPSGALTISSSGWGDGANVRLYEIITFVNVVPLTTVQQQQIEGYLAKKWGLTVSGQFLSTHPFRSIPPAILPFSPRNITGLSLWLDAADQGSMTLSGSNVTQWNDKSGNEKHATAGGTTPTYSSATRSIVFGGAGYFTNSSLSLPLSTRSVFIVCKQTSRAADFEGIMLLSSPSDGSIDYDSSTTIPYFASGSNVVVGDTAFSIYNRGTYVQNYRPYVLTPLGIYTDVFGSSSGTLYVNGTSNSTVADSSGLGTANGYILGARKFSGTTLSTFLNGTINEILVYNTALTTSQRQQVEGYLAHKWGLAGYYDSSIPLSIPGCQLWLDAADASTVTGTTSVTQWRDKSGNGRNTTTTGTVSYANSGISITTSSSYLTGSFGSPDYTGTTLSCFIVASMNSASGSVARLLGLGKVGTQDWDNLASMIAFARGGGLVLRTYRNSQTLASPPSIPAYDTRFLASSGQTSSATFMSINGGTISTQSLSGAFAINAYRIGHDLAPDDVNEQFNGVINEIIVYFSELTTTQRQSIEGYLARKWGFTSMYSALPSIHPYSKFPPA
jgi:hypothetical protein